MQNNIIGQIFGSWKVIEYNYEESQLKKRSMYLCECIFCKKVRFIRLSTLNENKGQICRCQSRDDITGHIFNSFKVIEYSEEESKKAGRSIYLCECLVCENLTYVHAANLKNGNSKSCCGSIKHGGYQEREYHILLDAIKRCHNKNHPAYKNYGARGITVCDRWREPNGQGYINFINDMGYRPSEDHSLNREDNNDGYYKENCEWATWQEQQQNRSNNTVTSEEVLSIREDREINKLSYKQLSEKYGKKLEQIGKICRYQSWDNIEISGFDDNPEN